MRAALSRLKQIIAEKGPPAVPTEPPKAPSVGFVGDRGGPLCVNSPSNAALGGPCGHALSAVLAAGKPSDVPLHRWRMFQDDGVSLCHQWGEAAMAQGWTPQDLFGCDATAPWARVDRLGLAWLMEGADVIDVTRTLALIKGARGTHSVGRRVGNG
jgi:hypothetical protein